MPAKTLSLLTLLIGLTVACATNTDTTDTAGATTTSTPQATTHDTAPVRPGPAVERLLQGTWQSLTDPSDTFTITGAKKIITPAGKPSLTLAFTYVPDCGGTVCALPNSGFGCFTTAGAFDIDCQTIVAISATELAVTNGNAGDTLRYRRKP